MKLKNGFSYDKHGWKYVSIRGTPKERGYAYGYLCAVEFAEIQKMLKFLMPESYGMSWEWFIKTINEDFNEMTKRDFEEFYEEMKGISEGCNANGCKTSLDEILAWNFYCSIPYWNGARTVSGATSGKEGGGIGDRCSAFMAVGSDWTEDGKIVVAHNSFCDYIDGQYMNVVLDIKPDKGNRIIMQTCPLWIWSGTDFFVTSAGFIGTETTIGGFNAYEKKIPVGYRIRKAMQYGKTLDDYTEMLLEGNSGDYANSWLIGDTKNNEILRIELGLKFHNIEKTKNGYFIGFNAPYDSNIRNLEVTNSGFYDVRRHQGARKVRLDDLMDKHKGNLNIEVAKQIIADHYDVYLLKDENPCSRTVCSHYDLDAREYMSQIGRPSPFAPHGALDGVVCDSTLASKMSFIGRFGNSCGIRFDANDYFTKHRQWDTFRPYIKDRPTQPWTTFRSKSKAFSFTQTSKPVKRHRTKRKQT
tara:strand:- start:1837 stop:3249 length:1413 start_codon:yes stop_codon:yes gene_type:complete